MRAAKLFYSKYPKLQEALSKRNTVYNQTMDLIERLEAEGKLTVLRPVHPVMVGRMEKDTGKLNDLYNEGYEVAKKWINQNL